jgi:single-stranded-DNA-specific exonuclease
MMKNLTIDRLQQVGSGRHMRLRLRSGRHSMGAIYFSATPETASIAQGDLVDVAFNPQINEFRGEQSVQMNIIDIRPACSAAVSPEMSGYHALRRHQLTADTAEALLPDRATLAMVWRYLAAGGGTVQESPMCLCRKIVRWSDQELSLGKLLTCLDIFADVGLLETQRLHKNLTIRLTPGSGKADLNESPTMQLLLQAKES